MKKDIFINGVTSIFEFSDEEDDALRGFIPMTQEIFNSCMKKCEMLGERAHRTYQKLIKTYPEYWVKYILQDDL